MFVTLEGAEGCGKSTQAAALAKYLQNLGYSVVLTREPGGTNVGEGLRGVLLTSRASTANLTPEAETLMFCAARAQLVTEVIRPALATNRLVVCDRYADSTLAYQVCGRGLARADVSAVLRFATGGLVPDLTVLLDLPPEVGLRRKSHSTGDRFEELALDFHRRVRDGYLALAREEPGRWRVFDAVLPPSELSSLIGRTVERELAIREASSNQD